MQKKAKNGIYVMQPWLKPISEMTKAPSEHTKLY